MRRKALFYGLLVLATLGLSHLLSAWRAWRAAPTVGSGAMVVAFGLGVLAAMLWLGFVLYEVDRAAGRVRHRIGLYEWVLARRAGPGAGPHRADRAWAAAAPPGGCGEGRG